MSTPANPLTPPTPTSIPSPTALEKILNDFEVASATIAGVAPLLGPAGTAVAVGASLADKLFRSILAGVRAHEAIKGQPLDLSLLHDIDPI